MKQKKLLTLPALIFAFVTQAQTGSFDKINVRSSLKLQDKTVTEIATDTLLTSESDSKIPTERAVKKYIDNNSSVFKKAGGGISRNGDSLYLGGEISGLEFYSADGSTLYSLGRGNLFMNLFNSFTGLGSYMQVGNGAMNFGNITWGGKETNLKLEAGGLYFMNAGSYTFYVNDLGTTYVSRLQIGVVHSSDFEHPLLNRTGSVVILDNLTQNKVLTLNSPSASKGDIWYIFNGNTSTEFNYTLNYPIYKSGNVSITFIPGNTEFRAMIVSDGTKWIQLN